MRSLLLVLSLIAMSSALFAQTPPIEPGVSQELARWRAARYSDVRYKLNLTLEKMSPVLKGTMEIRVRVSSPYVSKGATPPPADVGVPIVLDWRPIKGHEVRSTVSNVWVNGQQIPRDFVGAPDWAGPVFTTDNEHIALPGVAGENVIKLDFTSPILTSGSAITRYVDKEDGSEYIYSLFVPSDASTAFPVFDQPDLKARFQLEVSVPRKWKVISNSAEEDYHGMYEGPDGKVDRESYHFENTAPIPTYVFAFAAGEFVEHLDESSPADVAVRTGIRKDSLLDRRIPLGRGSATNIYVRKSQAAKFKPHAAEVFRLNREAVKYFEQYFDYKFPFPKYDLVLIPEFPFGGMEHAGATFLRESSIIFPQDPTKNDIVNRATLIFHETAHQWFGDTVTMRWFDDLWLKEGFATFTAYKALEKIMPEMNSWKVFYERIKQGAYQTDSTRGTTAIYQPIANLSAAKSAYGNIVYNKAPAFLRQAEFYLGEDKFQTAVRAFLKKHEFGNAGWEDLVKEFESASNKDLKEFSEFWVKEPGVLTTLIKRRPHMDTSSKFTFSSETYPANGMSLINDGRFGIGLMNYNTLVIYEDRTRQIDEFSNIDRIISDQLRSTTKPAALIFPNYGDYGYGIFLLDEKSRDYVLKNIQNEKDPFLRAMMWGALWDSVREGELDPRVFVELVVKVLMHKPDREGGRNTQGPDIALANARAYASEEDESTVATLLGRTGTALNYYIETMRKPDRPAPRGHPEADAGREEGRNAQSDDYALANARASASSGDLRSRVEEMLIERMRSAPSPGQRITYYRAFLNIVSSEKGRGILKDILNLKFEISDLKLKTKDKFDIVARLLILNDPDAPRLLADLEKTETTDDAKRYAYAARAGIGTVSNKAKYWNDFVSNKEISESWIEAAFGPWNSIRHSDLTLPYLERALRELPNHKRNRKIFFVNGWLGAFIGGQRSAEALAIVNKFLADNPGLDNDLRLKILENVDLIERAVRIRERY